MVHEQEITREEILFEPSERWRILKNLLLISFAFMIHFTAFMGMSNLQSSINQNQSLGTSSLAVIYGSLIISNIFLPTLIIRWLGCKWTISLAFIAYMPFIGAQFFPTFWSMIPASFAVGFGGGPLWCAKCTYLTIMSEAYGKISNIPTDYLVTRFFGLFFMFYQMAQVLGNYISSSVLSYGTIEQSTNTTNQTAVIEFCGSRFCHMVEKENPLLQRPSDERIYFISAIYLGCMVIASLTVAFGVDSSKRYETARTKTTTKTTGLKLLLVTLKLWKEKRQLLLLPITIFIGAEQAFLFADYNASFISCTWGINHIGYFMMCFGFVNAIGALLAGSAMELFGRIPVIILAFVLHLAILITLLLWVPSLDHYTLFLVLSGLWGICDAIWLVQVNALSGLLFPGMEEAAYSNFKLWEATGSVITYAYSPYLCTDTKLFVLIGILVIGVVCYLIIEFITNQTKKIQLHDDKTNFELDNNEDNSNDKYSKNDS